MTQSIEENERYRKNVQWVVEARRQGRSAAGAQAEEQEQWRKEDQKQEKRREEEQEQTTGRQEEGNKVRFGGQEQSEETRA